MIPTPDRPVADALDDLRYAAECLWVVLGDLGAAVRLLAVAVVGSRTPPTQENEKP